MPTSNLMPHFKCQGLKALRCGFTVWIKHTSQVLGKKEQKFYMTFSTIWGCGLCPLHHLSYYRIIQKTTVSRTYAISACVIINNYFWLHLWSACSSAREIANFTICWIHIFTNYLSQKLRTSRSCSFPKVTCPSEMVG